MKDRKKYKKEWRENNKEKEKEYAKKSREKNKDQRIEYYKEWASKNKDKLIEYRKSAKQKGTTRNAWIRRKYGICIDEQTKILECQNGLCPICQLKFERESDICVDHCHETNTVRGILHRKCNLLLGLAKDDKNLLGNAIKYLSKQNDEVSK